MSNNLTPNPDKRGNSVKRFYSEVLKLLLFYGGYSTTQVIRMRTEYSESGVRKRLKAMEEIGWLHKLKTNQILGDNKIFWALTRAGAAAAIKEHQDFITEQPKQVNLDNIAPSLIHHTLSVQACSGLINKLLEEQIPDAFELKPAKLLCKKVWDGIQEYYIPDLLYFQYLSQGNFDVGIAFEIELTPKTLSRYNKLFKRIESANENYSPDRPLATYIKNVCYICPDEIYDRLSNILSKANKTSLSINLMSLTDLVKKSVISDNSIVPRKE